MPARFPCNLAPVKIEACESADHPGWLRLREAIGLAEASLRSDYVNGTESSPVAFLEGLYVVPQARRKGVAASLVAAVCGWARGAGCRELASDAALENAISQVVHRALGFEETERVVFFRRVLE